MSMHQPDVPRTQAMSARVAMRTPWCALNGPRLALMAVLITIGALLCAPIVGVPVPRASATSLTLGGGFNFASATVRGECLPDGGTEVSFQTPHAHGPLPGDWGTGDYDLSGIVTLGALTPPAVVPSYPYRDGIPVGTVTDASIDFSFVSPQGSADITFVPRSSQSTGLCGVADNANYTDVAPWLFGSGQDIQVRWREVEVWFDYTAVIHAADGSGSNESGHGRVLAVDSTMSGDGALGSTAGAISFLTQSSQPLPEVCDNGSDDDGDGDIDAADLDCPPVVSVEGVSRVEGDSGTTEMHLPIRLSHPWTHDVEVTCELEENTATSPDDFSPLLQTIVIPAGEADGECLVDIIGDRVDENPETFRIHLLDPVNAVVITQGIVASTIINDDDPYIRIDSAPDVTEGDTGTTPIRFPLTLSNPSVNQPAQVTCVGQDMTATYPEDYTPASVTVTIPPGDTTAECVFAAVGDDEVEGGPQRFLVYLADPVRSQLAGDEAYATIVDDDTDEPPVDDTAPPVVVAVPDRDPNGRGWYRAPVTIDWQSTDPDPSSGTPTDPADSVVSVEGRDIEVTSDMSCDPAGNCANGVTTVSIDLTPPILTVLPLDDLLNADGQDPVIGVGSGFTLEADAMDHLSGVTRVEYFLDDDDPGRGDATEMDLDGEHYAAVVPGLDRGRHTIRVRARDAAGNWSDIERVKVRVTDITNADGCSLLQDDSERDNGIQLFDEQGDDTAVVCKDLAVDIGSGAFGPGATRSAGLAPGIIPAGTRVRSFLVHADRAYRISVNGDYLVRTITLDFDGGTVLGAAVRDATLKKTDVLGAPGTRLHTGLQYRGHEVNLRLNGSILNPEDALSIRADRQRVTITLQVGEAMDEVRIITTAGASISSSSTGFLVVDPPRSLRQDDFDTEHCPQSPPNQADCSGTSPSETGDDVAVIWEQQVHPVRLDKALEVDIRGDGEWSLANWDDKPDYQPIDAGTRIRSVILHVDREGDFSSFEDGDFAYVVGSKTFSREILGVITSDARLDASDLLGASGRLYPNGYADRGLDFDLRGSQYANDEQVIVSPDRHTITIRSHIANGMDEVRVILGQ